MNVRVWFKVGLRVLFVLIIVRVVMISRIEFQETGHRVVNIDRMGFQGWAKAGRSGKASIHVEFLVISSVHDAQCCLSGLRE